MLIRQIDTFIAEFHESSKNALLITGARQIGKTFSIREFGKQWKCFVEINFIENKEAADLLKNASGTDDLLLRLSALTNQRLEISSSSSMRFKPALKSLQPSSFWWKRVLTDTL